jgi:Protein of unknown function (DUF3048) N-terminal domain/Protein of unknown function (DUF3048) C-terminal domain
MGRACHGESVTASRWPVLLALAACLVGGACTTGRHEVVTARDQQTRVPQASPAPPTRTAHAAVLRPKPRYYPLTGLRAPSKSAVRRPALAVKIDNVVGAWPQAGLNRADIVFDVLVEGGLTRLMAVYQSHGAGLVGPIRSARPVDAWLLRLLHARYFGFSGASPKELRPVRNLGHAVLVYEAKLDRPFRRRADHAAPHNLFSSTPLLYRTFRSVAPRRHGPRRVFSYSPYFRQRPRGHRTRSATVPFPAATARWSRAGSHWVRTQDGRPDRLMSGQRISTSNVVIMSVRTAWTGIFETDGSQDPRPVTVGHGQCWVLRNGRRIHGVWQSTHIGAPLRLYDVRHHRIALRPGRTWVELMPRGETPTFRR